MVGSCVAEGRAAREVEPVILNVVIGRGVLAVVAQPSTSRQMQFGLDRASFTSLPFSESFLFFSGFKPVHVVLRQTGPALHITLSVLQTRALFWSLVPLFADTTGM